MLRVSTSSISSLALGEWLCALSVFLLAESALSSSQFALYRRVIRTHMARTFDTPFNSLKSNTMQFAHPYIRPAFWAIKTLHGITATRT
ncbi:hypothetical protein EDD21DRAFT_8559 [Dissophora ornata]|nr:hypothetical protein EDD21DRAFT_8559 [Dissophora ornata]